MGVFSFQIHNFARHVTWLIFKTYWQDELRSKGHRPVLLLNDQFVVLTLSSLSLFSKPDWTDMGVLVYISHVKCPYYTVSVYIIIMPNHTVPNFVYICIQFSIMTTLWVWEYPHTHYQHHNNISDYLEENELCIWAVCGELRYLFGWVRFMHSHV